LGIAGFVIKRTANLRQSSGYHRLEEQKAPMHRSLRMPKRIPIGTKYVPESRGPFVYRYIEFPNGRRVQLSIRKAVSCNCVARRQTRSQQTLITEVPTLRHFDGALRLIDKHGFAAISGTPTV